MGMSIQPHLCMKELERPHHRGLPYFMTLKTKKLP